MIKKSLGLLLFIILFISSMLNVFALEANLTLDKEKVDINDYINLKVEINSFSGGQIGITNIKGIESFDIISQSQSQSSSNSIIIINGKTQSNVKTILNLNLVLKAKNKGEYNIGPAILKRNKEEVKTNIVKIIVSGDKLFLNNNNLNINQVKPLVKKEEKLIVKPDNLKIEKYKNIPQKIFNNISLYVFIGVIIILILIFYFIIKKRPELFDFSNKNIEKKENNLNIENEKQIDFEEKPTKIIYPELTDEDFIIKISDILIIKLGNTYKIQGVKNKTFSEILNYIGEKEDNKIAILINKINKAKYSNYIGDNNEILYGVKEI